MSSGSSSNKQLPKKMKWTKRTILDSVNAVIDIKIEVQGQPIRESRTTDSPTNLDLKQSNDKGKGIQGTNRSLFLGTSSEDETDTIPLKHNNPSYPKTTTHDAIMSSKQHKDNDREKRPYHMEESEDDEDTKPIYILYKKDIKGDTSFLYPPRPASLPQGPRHSHQAYTSNTNATTNANAAMVDTGNQTPGNTNLGPSSYDESTNNGSAHTNPSRQYQLRARPFKARKMNSGEDGESDDNPIIVL